MYGVGMQEPAGAMFAPLPAEVGGAGSFVAAPQYGGYCSAYSQATFGDAAYGVPPQPAPVPGAGSFVAAPQPAFEHPMIPTAGSFMAAPQYSAYPSVPQFHAPLLPTTASFTFDPPRLSAPTSYGAYPYMGSYPSYSAGPFQFYPQTAPGATELSAAVPVEPEKQAEHPPVKHHPVAPAPKAKTRSAAPAAKKKKRGMCGC